MIKMKQTAAVITAMMMAVTCLPAAGFAAEGPAETAGQEPQIEDLLSVSGPQGEEVPLEEIDESEYNGFLYTLKDEATEEQIGQIEENIEQIDDEEVAEEVCSGEVYAAESLEVIEDVADLSAIDSIEPNYLVHAFYSEDPGDSYNRTMINTIRIKNVWNAGVLGQGQAGADTPVIAVMDTGLVGASVQSRRHEDLNYGRIIKPIYTKKYGTAEDRDGHGTFVTGQILATMGNHKGVSGLMPGVKVLPVRVLDDTGEGEIKDLISGLNHLTKRQDVDVVNMSFGTPFYSASFEKACKNAARKGMILVAAAGNESSTLFMYPAAFPSVVGVAAVRKDGGKWSVSEHNDSVDIAAPGVNVRSLGIHSTRSYVSMSGTSMAAPVVSALAAMTRSIDPSLKHNQFVKVLKKTARDKGKAGYDHYYGMGIVDFDKARQYVTNYKGRIRAVSTRSMKKPKRAKITSLKRGGNYVNVRSKKTKRASSYQVAIKKKGKKKYGMVRISSRKVRLVGLSRKTTYYVKVRGVRNVNGIMVYGKWSKTRKFRTK